jgi:hypothetical protein
VLKLMEEVKALDPASESGQRANSILESVKKMIEQSKEKPAAAPDKPPKKGS